ncbi:MAG: tetratricopeptide repeat protein [Alphaproteobacteria bacterium]|nr:tetratricopeptide repeat protein [Alphaproteobacteria bacterium]
MKKTAAMIGKASVCHQAGQFAKAERLYRDILKLDGRHADALRQLGLLYLHLNQPERAEEYLERAQRVQPDNPEILVGLGVAYRNQGKKDEAMRWHVQAQRARPDDPLIYNNIGGLYYERGNWHDAIQNFTQALRLQPAYAEAHYNLGNVFRKQGRIGDAIACYGQAIRSCPDYPEALLDLGVALFEQGRLNEAGLCYQQILRFHPDHPLALNNLGNVFRQTGKPAEAIGLYEKALRLKPDYAEAYVNYGTTLRDQGKLDEAKERFEQALRLRPDYVGALVSLGTIEQDFGKPGEAVACYERALQLDPDSLDAGWNVSLALLALGRFREGWAHYEKGLGRSGLRGPFVHRAKRWDGGAFPGKRLLIWSEQGLGDSLQFVRYAAMCKAQGGEVIVQCPPPLVSLFRNCPFIDNVITLSNENDFDAQISMMSLPKVFDTDLDTIPAGVPYLFVDEDSRRKWMSRFADARGLKVGLVWAGQSREGLINAQIIDKRRSLHLRELLPFFDAGGVNFYNLQMGKPSAQIDELGLRGKLIDYTADITDFADTAAIIENLDLVISVDTSVVHLAGGLGKPVWVLSRRDACWRWLQNREDSPWYPSARIFGQQEPGEWGPVIERVRDALERVAAKH